MKKNLRIGYTKHCKKRGFSFNLGREDLLFIINLMIRHIKLTTAIQQHLTKGDDKYRRKIQEDLDKSEEILLGFLVVAKENHLLEEDSSLSNE